MFSPAYSRPFCYSSCSQSSVHASQQKARSYTARDSRIGAGSVGFASNSSTSLAPCLRALSLAPVEKFEAPPSHLPILESLPVYIPLPDDYLKPVYEALEKRVQREVEETALAAKEISLLCEEMLFCFPKSSTPSPLLSSPPMATLLEETLLHVMEKVDFLFKILDCGMSNIECWILFTKLPKNQSPSILEQFQQNPIVKKQNWFLKPAFLYVCKIDQIAIQTLRPILLSKSIIKSFTQRSPAFAKQSVPQITTAALKKAEEIETQRKIVLFLTALEEIKKIAVEMGEFAAKANS